MTDVKERKRLLRARLRSRLRLLSAHEKIEASQRLCRAVMSHPAFWPPDLLLAFLAREDEISVDPIIEAALKRGVPVGVPRVKNATIVFHRLRHFQESFPLSPWRIREPLPTAPLIDPSLHEKGLILVPGLGFDLSGTRLGRGKGFYDRFLSSHPCLRSLGVGFCIQIAPKIPATTHDIQLGALCLENTLIYLPSPPSSLSFFS